MERPESSFYKDHVLEPDHWQPPYVLLEAYAAYANDVAGADDGGERRADHSRSVAATSVEREPAPALTVLW